jgi:nucleoside-diphosphate-sugar epimerase
VRVLLAGALGEVGASLEQALEASRHEVVRMSARAPLDGRPDVVGISEALSLILSGDVSGIVNASGPGDRRSEARQADTASDEIVAAASRAGIPAVLLSTTRVLEGYQHPPEEDAVPSPLSSYARANANHENVWLRYPNARVLRLVNFFGSPQGADSPQSKLLPWSLLTEGWATGYITVRSGRGAVKDFVDAAAVADAVELLFRSQAEPKVMATIPGVRISMEDLAQAVSAAVSATGRAEPLVSFGHDDAPASPPASGWLAGEGWKCRTTLPEMTEAMTRWLIEWGEHIACSNATREDR